ncbi:hypothetical protein ACYPJF_06225 [Stenotrophomonas geniculata]
MNKIVLILLAAMLTSPFDLEELMIGYGSHLDAYDSLMRLARKMEKIRKAR